MCIRDSDRSGPPSEEDVKSETQHCDDDLNDMVNDEDLALPNTVYVEEDDSLNSSGNNEPAKSAPPTAQQNEKSLY